jgi:short-subunit dehydrogenase
MSKVILITGISSGLGKAIASTLQKSEYIIYGTARRTIETEPGIHLLQMDVTNTESVKNGINKIIERESKIDIVINNAGFGIGGPIEEFTDDEAQLEINTNLYGMFRVCREVLPYMREKKEGLIINIGSLMGIIALPYQGFYTASKFAIEGLTETLRYEVKPFNIKVVLINPGDFSTNFTANRRTIQKITGTSPYFAQYSKTMTIVEKDEHNGLKPEVLAKKIQSIIKMKNPRTRYIIASFEQKLAVWLKSVLPAKIFYKIIGGHYGM